MHESSGYRFWRENLGCPRLIVAPMVDQSELAWRLLSRKYGAELCYSPMLHASVFVKDLRYRKENLQSCAEDRPLIVQFCANDPDTFVEACKLVSGCCECIDLNLGCPQAIARRGRYGAFLQDEWNLLKEMISRATKEVDVPITCKIRVFHDVKHTVEYAQMLEAAGCQLLTVHGRTRDQKGPLTGVASWKHIKAVKSSVKIPVFANGNIQYLSDVYRCIKETGVDGVMTAEGNLHNPALFQGINPPVWEMCLDYLEFVKRYPCPMSFVRGHIFKMCHHCLLKADNKEIRQQIAVANDINKFVDAVLKLKEKYENEVSEISTADCHEKYGLPFPPWICQPYVRPSPESITCDTYEELSKQVEIKQKRTMPENGISRKKLKKLQRNPEKKFEKKQAFEKCSTCLNPKGSKCAFQLCKSCCRGKTIKEVLDCIGHGFNFKKKKESQAGVNKDSISDNVININEVNVNEVHISVSCL